MLARFWNFAVLMTVIGGGDKWGADAVFRPGERPDAHIRPRPHH